MASRGQDQTVDARRRMPGALTRGRVSVELEEVVRVGIDVVCGG